VEENRLLDLKNAMETEIQNLLGFWEKHVFCKGSDKVFYGKVDGDLIPYERANKHVVLAARLVWTFSVAYRILGGENYKELARRVYDYFTLHFIDGEYGGVFWELNAGGVPLDVRKCTYGQAFAIYALSEYYRTFNDQSALDEAIRIYSYLQTNAYDREHKGYYEILMQDWKFEPTEQVGDVNPYRAACKIMNTNLHMLEAYTSLYKVWKDQKLKEKLKEQIQVMTEKILNRTNWHYMLYFDRCWNSITDDISYGHDIEGSWLLWEAAECIGDEEVCSFVKPITIKMAEAVFNEGWHEAGGIIYESRPDGEIKKHRSWWVQSEAVVGFFNAWQLTGDCKYIDAVERLWKFINKEIIDHENGGWFAYAVSDGIRANRVDGWTCPYHNARMCFEIMERVKQYTGYNFNL